jgi:hypothetical protein
MEKIEFPRSSSQSRLRILRQRPLAAIASRALQLVMLTGILLLGLLSLGLVLAAATGLAIYALVRQWRARRSGNFRIQFAVGR